MPGFPDDLVDKAMRREPPTHAEALAALAALALLTSRHDLVAIRRRGAGTDLPPST